MVPFIRALQSRFGEDAVLVMVREFVEEMSSKIGAEVARTTSGTPVEQFYALVPKFSEDKALEVTVLEHSPKACRFNVTRCRYAEFYKEMGAADLGLILSCHRDFGLVKGISEDLQLLRTSTIMEGADHCDFHLKLK